MMSTTTVYVPPRSACCGAATSTVTVEGACGGCQEGCYTKVVTAVVTMTGGLVPGATV